MDLFLLFVVGIAIVIFITFTLLGIYLEVKEYNHGICKVCGNKLKYFDTDSQGGRGYICYDCHYYTFVSWPCVDKNYKEEIKK